MIEEKNRIAPKGKVWVCCACGKTSKDRYGLRFPEETTRGWDESCLLNSQLFDKDKLIYSEGEGRVLEVKE